MQNINPIINNMDFLNNTTKIEKSCNYRTRNNYPLDGKCLIRSIYEALITLNKICIGKAEIDLKHRFNNRIKSFSLEYYENDRELSKKHWAKKHNHLELPEFGIAISLYFSEIFCENFIYPFYCSNFLIIN